VTETRRSRGLAARLRAASLRGARAVIAWPLVAAAWHAAPAWSQAPSGAAPPASPAPSATTPRTTLPEPGAVLPAAAPAPAPLLVDARRLLDAGRAEEAFRLLDARAASHAGDVEFDYLLGLAALDSNRPGQAVLALERVLATQPDHLQARAEIGRAFLALREVEAARREFEAVARTQLPPEVRDTVERFLDTVARLETAGKAQWIRIAEVAAGWDTNVNFGSSFGTWPLADGQALVPLPASRPRESAFLAGSLGLTYVAPLDGGWEWTAGALLAQRVNPSAHNIDTGTVDVSAGVSKALGAHRFSMSGQFQHLRLDDSGFRDALGAIAQWQWDSGPRTQVGAFGQVFDLSFPGEHIRDALRYGGGLTAAHGFDARYAPTIVLGASAGREATREDLPQLSFDYAGARAALGLSLRSGMRATGGLSFERRSFDGVEPLFGVRRVDEQWDVRAGLEWDVDRSWTVAPTLAYTRNRSTLAPNDFRRTQAFVAARYRF